MPADRLDPDQVECPTCQAPPGSVCRYPSGRKSRTIHHARRRAAADAGTPAQPDTPPRKRKAPPNAGKLTAEDRAKGGKAAQEARRRRKEAIAAKAAEAEAAALAERGEKLAADAARYAEDRAALRRLTLDATRQVGRRLADAAEHMERPAGYDSEGRPRTRKVEAYVTDRYGKRTRVLDDEGRPVVVDKPDVVGFHAPETVERLARAYGAAVNALRLEEGKPTGITRDDTGGSAAEKLGDAGVDELVAWAAANLPPTGGGDTPREGSR